MWVTRFTRRNWSTLWSNLVQSLRHQVSVVLHVVSMRNRVLQSELGTSGQIRSINHSLKIARRSVMHWSVFGRAPWIFHALRRVYLQVLERVHAERQFVADLRAVGFLRLLARWSLEINVFLWPENVFNSNEQTTCWFTFKQAWQTLCLCFQAATLYWYTDQNQPKACPPLHSLHLFYRKSVRNLKIESINWLKTFRDSRLWSSDVVSDRSPARSRPPPTRVRAPSTLAPASGSSPAAVLAAAATWGRTDDACCIRNLSTSQTFFNVFNQTNIFFTHKGVQGKSYIWLDIQYYCLFSFNLTKVHFIQALKIDL